MPFHASRFAANLAALISGGLGVVFSLTFRPGVSAWLVLGLSAAAVIAALAAFAMPDQGAGGRTIEVLVVLVGGWAIVSSRVFSDPHVTKWLCFAAATAIWTLGALGLVAHERLLERRLRRMTEQERHRLAMTRSPAGAGPPAQRTRTQ